MSNNTSVSPAFFVQSAIAFAVSAISLAVGIIYLPLDAWQRGFFALGSLFLITSCFNLAKVIRDKQEETKQHLHELQQNQSQSTFIQ